MTPKEPWQEDEPVGDSEAPMLPPGALDVTKMLTEITASMKALTPVRPLFPFVMDGGTYVMRDDGAVYFYSDSTKEWHRHSALPGTPAAMLTDEA